MVGRLNRGEEWRLPNGNEVIIDEVEGDTVHGTVRPAAITGSGAPRGTVGVAVYVGSVSEFDGATLIGPRWRVRVIAPAPGSHPTQDPVFESISAVGEIEHRSRPVVETDGAATVRAGEARYDVLVLAVDEISATQVVADAVASAGHGEATIEGAQRIANA